MGVFEGQAVVSTDEKRSCPTGIFSAELNVTLRCQQKRLRIAVLQFSCQKGLVGLRNNVKLVRTKNRSNKGNGTPSLSDRARRRCISQFATGSPQKTSSKQ